MVARADIDPVDAVDACRPKQAVGGCPEVEHPVRRQVGVEALGNLRPDLVAARPDRRAYAGRFGAVAERCDAGCDQPAGEPLPARVQNGKSSLTGCRGDDDRQAVGRHRQKGHSCLVRPEAVAFDSAPAGVRAVHGRGVDLAVQRERHAVEPERLACDSPVLLDARTVVAGADGEVERSRTVAR